MSYSVSQLAKLSGVSVRTLHFYDEIGLLPPASVKENGYRVYEEAQLLRLQQILIYREMGMSLAEIQRVMEGDDFDVLVALESHRQVLRDQVRDKQALLDTVESTIDHLRGKVVMNQKAMFKGFDPKKQEEYERELIAKGGEDTAELIAESKRRMATWSQNDFDDVKQETDAIHNAFVELLRAGKSPEDAEVMSAVRRHYLMIHRFYTPTREIYLGLAQMYLDHPDFRKLYDSYDPGLAAYLAAAIRHFAELELD